MTILLSLTVFLNTVSDTMPVTSDSPILGNHENENMENYEVYISPLPYLAVAIATIWISFHESQTKYQTKLIQLQN